MMSESMALALALDVRALHFDVNFGSDFRKNHAQKNIFFR